MSSLASWNFIFIAKLSFNLQPRLLSLQWLKRSGVRCFAHKADDPEFPVRYIPKKRQNAKQTESPGYRDNSHQDGMATSSDIRNRQQNTVRKMSKIRTQRSAGRLSLHDEHELNRESGYGEGVRDTEHVRPVEEVVEELRQRKWGGEIGFGNEFLHIRTEDDKESEEVVHELQIYNGTDRSQQFKSNQDLSDSHGVIDADYMDVPDEDFEEMEVYNGGGKGKQERARACRIKQDAEKVAVELLAKRAFTAVELRKKLMAKHFPLNIVQEVIHDFLVKGLINDRLYAETFSQSRWTSSSWGPRRIKQALSKKGVSEVDVKKAVKLVFEDGEDGDESSSLRLSNSSVEKLYVQASKQWQRSLNVPHETRKARIIRWLQYRGFDWGVVSIILKKLESQHPP